MKNTTHAILDCWLVSQDVCNDDRLLCNVLERAAIKSNCEVIAKNRYKFGHNSPEGCTVFLMLDESHISVHTYAVEGRMAIDVFMSSSKEKCKTAINYIIQELQLKHTATTFHTRFVDNDNQS
jgi:S-adenosylmethionine decarboxylase